MQVKNVLTINAILAVLSACEPSVPNGKIRIKNDSQDSTYNTLSVSGGGVSCSLSPGEACFLPKGTRNIGFSRQYSDYTRYYQVSCPPLAGSGITIKLIDVHLNRMSGGCQTTSATKG